MFEGQPKGLYALALANTGERFGYYTMLAIFTLFLQAKFGFSSSETSTIFGGFLALVYFMPLVGGILADKFGYGKMVATGIIIMFGGYLLLAVPSGIDQRGMGTAMMFAALFLIAMGTGLFKGNLQVMVGNLYDRPQYNNRRDTGFSIFYMAINIGALFAPTAATKVTNYFMGRAGLSYDANIPELAHQFLNNTIKPEGIDKLTSLASQQGFSGDLGTFSAQYIEQLSLSYNYGFAVACISLIVSMAIYLVSKPAFKHTLYSTKQNRNVGDALLAELTPAQTKERVTALLLVFAVVIFFWMSFHQNGLTMTFFARDYTANIAEGITRIGFDVWNLVLMVVAVYGGFSIFQSKTSKAKLISGVVTSAALLVLVWKYSQMPEIVKITPQIFQQFNPFFVVALTPVSLSIFSSLARKGKEPSAPRKIGYGMFVAALGFLILAVGSLGLKSPEELQSIGGVSDVLVSPNWLISTYLVLTFAELLLSPMGISFVSKVAPPKFKGAMMGAWFAATAIGNYLTSIIGYLWGALPLWMVWGVLIVCCLLSALFIFLIMKKLERATGDR